MSCTKRRALIATVGRRLLFPPSQTALWPYLDAEVFELHLKEGCQGKMKWKDNLKHTTYAKLWLWKEGPHALKYFRTRPLVAMPFLCRSIYLTWLFAAFVSVLSATCICRWSYFSLCLDLLCNTRCHLHRCGYGMHLSPASSLRRVQFVSYMQLVICLHLGRPGILFPKLDVLIDFP